MHFADLNEAIGEFASYDAAKNASDAIKNVVDLAAKGARGLRDAHKTAQKQVQQQTAERLRFERAKELKAKKLANLAKTGDGAAELIANYVLVTDIHDRSDGDAYGTAVEDFDYLDIHDLVNLQDNVEAILKKFREFPIKYRIAVEKTNFLTDAGTSKKDREHEKVNGYFAPTPENIAVTKAALKASGMEANWVKMWTSILHQKDSAVAADIAVKELVSVAVRNKAFNASGTKNKSGTVQVRSVGTNLIIYVMAVYRIIEQRIIDLIDVLHVAETRPRKRNTEDTTDDGTKVQPRPQEAERKAHATKTGTEAIPSTDADTSQDGEITESMKKNIRRFLKAL